MKFGNYLKENILNPWIIEYIQYDLLKLELKNRQLDHEWNEQDESDFIQLFINERNKVTQFIANFNQQLISRIRYSEHLLKSSTTTHQNEKQKQQTSGFLNTLDDPLMEIIFDIHDFSNFIHLNKMGFEKILKKHRKWTLIDHIDISGYKYQHIDSSLEVNWNSSFYTQVSLLRYQCLQHFDSKQDQTLEPPIDLATIIPSLTPERRSKKYWVHTNHISEITAILCMHAYIVQPPSMALNDGKKKQFDFSMSNAYFDNDYMDVYSDRLADKENAQTIKCKRYGSVSKDHIYFEDEVHSTFYSGDISSKKRFRMDHCLLHDFYKGDYKINEPSPAATVIEEMDEKEAMKLEDDKKADPELFAKEMQDSIISSDLKPTVQCDYHRLYFQNHPSSNTELSITLDTNISFSSFNNRDDKQFFSSDTDQNKRVLFPYAVLEVKVSTDTKLDDPSLYWLNAFTSKSKLVHEVPKFSKYLQGVYQLYSDTNSSLLVPGWTELYKKGIAASTVYNGISRTRSLRPLLNGKPYRSVIPYSAGSNNERIRRNQQELTTVLGKSRHDSSTDEYISISTNNNDLLKSDDGVQARNDRYKVVLDMNEKTEMNYFYPINGKSSRSLSSTSTFFNQKYNSTSNIILDQDGNPIMYSNQQQGKQKKNKKSAVIKIEPKVFFANERTFISWLQFCALLLTVALNLLNFGDRTSRICGGLFLFISMLLALYALARFQYRAWQLRIPNQTGRFDDIYGPAVLCVLIVAALVVNFWLRFSNIEQAQNNFYPSSASNSTQD